MEKDLIIIGAGAAGYFAGIIYAEAHPNASVIMLEKNRQVLAKVRISGGGRCNVTHSCFVPELLIKKYPRGSKELLGPFHRFQPQDTINWFSRHGVKLKTEEDGRIFPITDSSQTIIDALENARLKSGVMLQTEVRIISIKKEGECFLVDTDQGQYRSKKILLATGSSSQGHAFASQFGHTITPLAPSLFSFNIPKSPLLDLSGISLEDVEVSIAGTKLKERGPMLLTHWGFSGPAVLRLSAWGARILQEMEYHATLKIDWTPDTHVKDNLQKLKNEHPAKTFQLQDIAPLPKNLAERLLKLSVPYAHLKNSDIERIEQVLKRSTYQIEGKTTYKQEFVTCGGVALKEVNFQTMESKLCPGLYFAGEILDIDGITGGFNFQNAWTTGWIAGNA